MDYIKGIHRGFAFIEYESADDADEAIFNMDLSEILGQTISVSVAQVNQIHHLSTTTTTTNTNSNNNNQQAIWNHDEWFQQQIGQTTQEELNHIQNQKDDVQTLQKI
jgi:peptidyl-prolyl isomerase E (cyclophilin E)